MSGTEEQGVVAKFAAELRKWWSFDDRQMHTHTWHSREDFIADKLPALLRAPTAGVTEEEIARAWCWAGCRGCCKFHCQGDRRYLEESGKLRGARAVLSLLPKATPGVNAEMLAALHDARQALNLALLADGLGSEIKNRLRTAWLKVGDALASGKRSA